MGHFLPALVYLALSTGDPAFRGFKLYFSRAAFSVVDIMSHNWSPWVTRLPVEMQLTEVSKAATRSFNLSGMILHAISFICLQVQNCCAYFILQKLSQMF